jgi:hypothetical protein
MFFTSDLLETPPSLSAAASKWTAMNCFIYLGMGALLTIFRDDGFAGTGPCWVWTARRPPNDTGFGA